MSRGARPDGRPTEEEEKGPNGEEGENGEAESSAGLGKGKNKDLSAEEEELGDYSEVSFSAMLNAVKARETSKEALRVIDGEPFWDEQEQIDLERKRTPVIAIRPSVQRKPGRPKKHAQVPTSVESDSLPRAVKGEHTEDAEEEMEEVDDEEAEDQEVEEDEEEGSKSPASKKAVATPASSDAAPVAAGDMDSQAGAACADTVGPAKAKRERGQEGTRPLHADEKVTENEWGVFLETSGRQVMCKYDRYINDGVLVPLFRIKGVCPWWPTSAESAPIDFLRWEQVETQAVTPKCFSVAPGKSSSIWRRACDGCVEKVFGGEGDSCRAAQHVSRYRKSFCERCSRATAFKDSGDAAGPSTADEAAAMLEEQDTDKQGKACKGRGRKGHHDTTEPPFCIACFVGAPEYRWPTGLRRTHCRLCKKKGMINFNRCTFEDGACRNRAYYGLPEQELTRCEKHIQEGMLPNLVCTLCNTKIVTTGKIRRNGKPKRLTHCNDCGEKLLEKGQRPQLEYDGPKRRGRPRTAWTDPQHFLEELDERESKRKSKRAVDNDDAIALPKKIQRKDGDESDLDADLQFERGRRGGGDDDDDDDDDEEEEEDAEDDDQEEAEGKGPTVAFPPKKRRGRPPRAGGPERTATVSGSLAKLEQPNIPTSTIYDEEIFKQSVPGWRQAYELLMGGKQGAALLQQHNNAMIQLNLKIAQETIAQAARFGSTAGQSSYSHVENGGDKDERDRQAEGVQDSSSSSSGLKLDAGFPKKIVGQLSSSQIGNPGGIP